MLKDTHLIVFVDSQTGTQCVRYCRKSNNNVYEIVIEVSKLNKTVDYFLLIHIQMIHFIALQIQKYIIFKFLKPTGTVNLLYSTSAYPTFGMPKYVYDCSSTQQTLCFLSTAVIPFC